MLAHANSTRLAPAASVSAATHQATAAAAQTLAGGVTNSAATEASRCVQHAADPQILFRTII